jgi:hypothetical protein
MAVNYSTSFTFTIAVGNPPKEITVSPGDLSQVSTKGFHFKLPEDSKITLGSLTTFITWLNGKLKDAGSTIVIPTQSGSSWPDTVKSVFDGVLNAEVSVTELQLDQDPKPEGAKEAPPLDIRLTVIAEAKPEISIANGFFTVKHAGVLFIRSHTADAPQSQSQTAGGKS